MVFGRTSPSSTSSKTTSSRPRTGSWVIKTERLNIHLVPLGKSLGRFMYSNTVHPGKLTAGTWTSSRNEKENSLNQTSILRLHVSFSGVYLIWSNSVWNQMIHKDFMWNWQFESHVNQKWHMNFQPEPGTSKTEGWNLAWKQQMLHCSFHITTTSWNNEVWQRAPILVNHNCKYPVTPVNYEAKNKMDHRYAFN